jgi:hypothetical protein
MRNIEQERELHQKIDKKIYDLLVLANGLISLAIVGAVIYIGQTIVGWFL